MGTNELAAHPSAVPTLPPEILLDIIGLLRHFKDSLLSCCLVNHFFHRMAEQVLVSCLQFSCADEALASLKIFSFLEAHPSLTRHIHCLTFDWDALAFDEYPSVITELENLRTLRLIGWDGQAEWTGYIPWSFVSRSSHIWLQHHLPRITTLKLSDWDACPVHFLLSCTNLRHLELDRVIFSDKAGSGEDLSIVITTPFTLDSLRIANVFWSPLLLRFFQDPQVTVKKLSLYLGLTYEEGQFSPSNYIHEMARRFELLPIICSRNQDTLRHLTFTGPTAMITRSSTFFPSAFSNLRSYRVPMKMAESWDVGFLAPLCSDLKRSSSALDLFIDGDYPQAILLSCTTQIMDLVPSWKVLDEGMEDVLTHRPLCITFTISGRGDTVKLNFWESIVKEFLLPKTNALGVLRFEYRKTPPCC